jgi:hypothetical protein
MTIERQQEKQERTYEMSSMTGRPRKLSDGVMLKICEMFADGRPAHELSELFGVSVGTIYAICYWTPRNGRVSGE